MTSEIENKEPNIRIAYLMDTVGFDCAVFAYSSVEAIEGQMVFREVLGIQGEFQEDGNIMFRGFSPFSYWSKDFEISIPSSLVCGTMELMPKLVPIYKEALVQIKASLNKQEESPVRKILKMERPKQ
jgi:hypothetical protein